MSNEPPSGRMPQAQLRLAIHDCLMAGLDVAEAQARLLREDPAEVGRLYQIAKLNRRRPRDSPDTRLASKGKRRPGRQITEAAEDAGMDRATLVALLEVHGFLERRLDDNNKPRLLVSAAATAGGLGCNLEGESGLPFPVLFPESLPDVLWSLDLQGIHATAGQLPTRQERLAWALEQHGYLPDREVAALTGYSVRGVEQARVRARRRLEELAISRPLPPTTTLRDYGLCLVAQRQTAPQQLAA